MPDGFVCPTCGWPGLAEPPWENGSPSDAICPSCGIHYGYDDAFGGDAGRRAVVYREWRQRWIAGGMTWWSTKASPVGWNPEEQVRSVAG